MPSTSKFTSTRSSGLDLWQKRNIESRTRTTVPLKPSLPSDADEQKLSSIIQIKIHCAGKNKKGERCGVKFISKHTLAINIEETEIGYLPIERYCIHHREEKQEAQKLVYLCAGITKKGVRCKNKVASESLPPLSGEEDPVKLLSRTVFCHLHSNPALSDSRPSSYQCAAITIRNQTRCKNRGLALAVMGDADWDDGDPLETFCLQHQKKMNKDSGGYSKDGEWIVYEDWIPSYLQGTTQAALRALMPKPLSQKEADGCIYVYEIKKPSTVRGPPSITVKFKIGRTENLAQRINQWQKQCKSQECVPRGAYPRISGEFDQSSLSKAQIKNSQSVLCSKRLERLIHLEIADLASTGIYLDPSWPKIVGNSRATSTDDASKPPRPICADCGKRHKEIFEFERWTEGRNVGKEWIKIVEPVIEKWGKFVETYM